VLVATEDLFGSDSLLIGGDSGGPFFDLEGRLAGILHSTMVPSGLDGVLDDPAISQIGPWSALTNSFVQPLLSKMLRCEVTPHDPEAYRRFVSRNRDDRGGVLPRCEWTQGNVTTGSFRQAAIVSRSSVASILDEAGIVVALGTIVAEGGWILTVASTLPAEPRCKLVDGRILASDVPRIDPAFDLALLKIPVSALIPVKWSEWPHPVVGTMLAAVGPSDSPLAIGVVSVSQRDPPGPFASRVSRPAASPPAISGGPTIGGYLVEAVGGSALIAGIRPGCVIGTIAGKEIHDDRDLREIARGRRAGERLPVHLIQGGHHQNLILELAGEIRHNVDLPRMFEHDMPLSLPQRGGPIIDRDGGTVGITVFRGAYGCVAVPEDCLKRILAARNAGGLDDKWVKPPQASPSDLLITAPHP